MTSGVCGTVRFIQRVYGRDARAQSIQVLAKRSGQQLDGAEACRTVTPMPQARPLSFFWRDQLMAVGQGQIVQAVDIENAVAEQIAAVARQLRNHLGS